MKRHVIILKNNLFIQNKNEYLKLVYRTKLNDTSTNEKTFSSLSKDVYAFEIKNMKFEELIKRKEYPRHFLSWMRME